MEKADMKHNQQRKRTGKSERRRSTEPKKIPYIPLGILNLASRTAVSLDAILAALLKGQDCVLLGDYGAGKSMTLRYLHGELKKRHLRGDLWL